MRRLAAVASLLLMPALAGAQTPSEQALATGLHFQGYAFDDSIGVTAANLMLVPIAYQLPLGDRLGFDLYTGYARGAVERRDVVYQLNGPVDTRVRASWVATPWAVLMLGVNVPTGKSTHDTEEAIVAGAMATNLLGFREASWGTGLAVTSGVATAHRFGDWGLGLGASYRLGSEFEPRADTAVGYTPGNEALVRLALDRNVGASGKFTAGFTLQNYSADKLDRRDLFQSGNRWRGDVTYSFRAGRSSVWSLYLADIWRERGDITLDVLDTDGSIVGDTTFHTGTQNLMIVGLAGSMTVGRTLLRPSIDARVQQREEVGGQGWLLGGGLDVPLRLRGYEVLPAGRLSYGNLEAESGKAYPFWGAELGLTLRWEP